MVVGDLRWEMEMREVGEGGGRCGRCVGIGG